MKDYTELIDMLRIEATYQRSIFSKNLIASELDQAADAIIELMAENAELREANRWIPCNERLPEEGQEVEVMNAQDIISAKYEPNHNQFFPWLRLDTQHAIRRAAECVTHWRLPNPPHEGRMKRGKINCEKSEK